MRSQHRHSPMDALTLSMETKRLKPWQRLVQMTINQMIPQPTQSNFHLLSLHVPTVNKRTGTSKYFAMPVYIDAGPVYHPMDHVYISNGIDFIIPFVK